LLNAKEYTFNPDVHLHFIHEELYGNRAIVISHFLSDQECDNITQFMDEDVADNMHIACSKTSYRNHMRIFAKSDVLSNILFQRIKIILDTVHESNLDYRTDDRPLLYEGLGMRGEWKLESLNPMFRLSKYSSGGHFAPHTDGDYCIDPISHRSMKTFMIYLNDDYEEGSTAFLKDGVMGEINEERGGIRCANKSDIVTTWKPRKGDCILFDHCINHEGQQVVNGMKYIMRSDVMYKRTITDLTAEERALQIYYDGEAMEEHGNVDGAILNYKRAFRLCPDIERKLWS
jgi:hypothetical protein